MARCRICAALLLAAPLMAGCIPRADPPSSYAPPPQRTRPRPYTPPPVPMPAPSPAADEDRYERRSIDADLEQPQSAPSRRRRAAAQDPSPPRQRLQLDSRTLGVRPALPSWEAAPVTPDAQYVPGSSHVVRPGETLRGIGNATGAGSDAIARANDIPPPFVVQPGQRLSIPGGRYHLVRSGQSGIAIARAYGVSWSRLIAVNGLEEPFTLRVGQRLLIPDLGPRTLEERAAAFKLNIDDIITGGEPATSGKPAPPTRSPSRVLPPSAPISEPSRLAGGFAWPLRGRVIKTFGPGRSGEREDGIEIAAPLDTPILAAADGVVAYVGSGIQSLGGIVILKHGQGWTSIYGHAGQLMVQRGQSVRRGQTIALTGDSGNASQPSLHFEIRNGRSPVDPIEKLPPR